MIISGFPGIGKTYFYENNADVADSDSSKFPKYNFPQNYIEHIKSENAAIVLVSSHIEVRKALVEERLYFTLVYH